MEFTWREEASDGGSTPGGVVLSSFPSAGLATTVAGHYIVRTLKLPRVARFEGPELSPVAVVQSGEVHPSIRVYGRPDLSLVLSEFPPTPAQASAAAETILGAAERRRARLIVGLEGVVPHPGDGDDQTEGSEPNSTTPSSGEHVWVAYSRKDPALVKAFERTNAKPLEEGLIGGVSGALLVRGIGRSIPVGVLLVSARPEGVPDHRAGAALIETLDQLLPELKIDTGPLRQQAEQIERMLRVAMKGRTPESPSLPEHVPSGGMYG